MRQGGLRRGASAVFVALMLSALSACFSGPDPQPGLVPAVPVAELGQTGYSPQLPADYTLRPSDVIAVSVFREEGLTLESVPVSASGEISFPLVGMMEVQGLTANQLETRLEQALNERFLRNPDVTVNILEYTSHQVTVEGSVTNPGLFTFLPGTRLSGGLALANGIARVADEENVAIFRDTPEGRAVAKFNYRAVQNGTAMDPVLQPGDRIVVGLDNLAQLYEDFLRTLPTLGFFYRLAEDNR
jgi:polysaccharide export outer membrane protein